MKEFNAGFNLKALPERMDFEFGDDCFGPLPEKRSLDSIRKSLLDPGCEGPDPVYSIVMDVGKKKHRQLLHDMHLLYGVVTFAAGRLGREPVRSQGHVHKKSDFACSWSTPELYEIWEGEAIIYMQENAADNPGRCFAVRARQGELVLVPPGWAHMTINASPEHPMTFGAWCDREYGFVYEEVRAHGGLAWYPVLEEDGRIYWEHNNKYLRNRLEEKSPGDYSGFGLAGELPMYTQFEKKADTFNFIPRPDRYRVHWEKFIP